MNPAEVQKEVVAYLEANPTPPVVNVHEDNCFPLEYLSKGEVRLLHYMNLPATRNWDPRKSREEWDRVIFLNRGRRFLILDYRFEDFPTDRDLFLDACTRNGVTPEIVRTFSNRRSQPVYVLYRID